jgi:Glycine/D-amino acid oxidases (deaminating)
MSVFHDAPSYWQATAPAPVMSTDLPATAQIVVVGGGFFGAATAYFLARAGAAPLVIEQVAPAYGATGRNGGFTSSERRKGMPMRLRGWGATRRVP